MTIGNAMGRAVVRGHGSTVRSSVSPEAVYGCCRRRGVDSQTTGNTAVVSLPGRFSARIVVRIRGSSTGQFARGFCGSRVTISLRETGGSQSTRDFSWNRDGLDSYGVAASSEEDFGAQRLDKGLARAEVVPEEGAAVFGRETAARLQGGETRQVVPEADV